MLGHETRKNKKDEIQKKNQKKKTLKMQILFKRIHGI